MADLGCTEGPVEMEGVGTAIGEFGPEGEVVEVGGPIGGGGPGAVEIGADLVKAEGRIGKKDWSCWSVIGRLEGDCMGEAKGNCDSSNRTFRLM